VNENGNPRVCLHCEWSSTEPGMAAQGLGVCRRFPPTGYPIAAGSSGQTVTMSVWPTVRLAHDTCGEFKAETIQVAVRLPPGEAAGSRGG